MTNLGYGAASIRETRDSVHVRYQEYSHRVERTGHCPVCGKRRKRSQTFTGTVNPFNVHPISKLPKTAAQVMFDLQEQGSRWVPDFACQTHSNREVCAVVGHEQPPLWNRCRRCGAATPPAQEESRTA